jgi:ABC-type transport system involved in multi-copper enzyme maturation permease subunit
MLWYKAWRESRSRFLIAAGAVGMFSLSVLLGARTNFPPPHAPHLPYSAFVWGEFYGNGRAAAFSIIALLLGLGGLQRERSNGTAPFTLALPVARGQFIAARIGVGLLELCAIALIPVVIVPALSPVLVRQAYPWSQSLQYGVLFMSWGVVWFAVAMMWSVLLAGDFTAAVISMLSPFAYMIGYGLARGDQRFPAANPFAMMSGELDRGLGGRMLLIEPMPWAAMLVLAVAAAGLLFGAWRATVRQNF